MKRDKIIAVIKDNPGIRANDLHKKTFPDMRTGTFRNNIKNIAKLGFIVRNGHGRRVRYYCAEYARIHGIQQDDPIYLSGGPNDPWDDAAIQWQNFVNRLFKVPNGISGH